MANYTPSDVLAMVTPFVKSVPTTAMQYIAFDDIHATIWKAYPWYWTLKSLTAVPLVDGTQDYTNGNASDFMRLVTARITRTDITPNRYQELTITHFLPPELNVKTAYGNFKLICIEPQSRKLRIESAAQVASGVTLQIDGTYQFQPTKIVSAAFSTALLSPDYHVKPYIDGLLYWSYLFTNDARAGSVSIDRAGQRHYSGQLGLFYDSIYSIASEEDGFQGSEFEFPTDSIGASLGGQVLSIFGP